MKEYKKPWGKLLCLLFFVSLAIFLFGCEKNEDTQTPGQSGPPTTQPRTTTSPQPTTTLPPENTNRDNPDVISLSPSPEPSINPTPNRVVTTESALFAFFPQQRLTAQDFKIGPLQDTLLAPLDFIKAAAVVKKFISSIMSNKPDYSLIAEDSKLQLEAVIAYPLSQGYTPDDYRLGKMSFEGEKEIRANIRMFRGEAVTEGEIYLEKAETDWLVIDLQVGFTLLGRKYQKSTEPFMPGSYDFLLHD